MEPGCCDGAWFCWPPAASVNWRRRSPRSGIPLLPPAWPPLDPLVRYDLQEDLREIFRTLKKTVVLVTHHMGEAGFFGDEVALMGEGKIVQRGEFSELLQHPKNDFVRKFIQAQRLPLKVEGGADR